MPDALEAVAITAGAGTNVATDKVTQSAVDYYLQVVKVGLGADGTLNLYLTNGQAVKANSLPVTVASDQGVLGNVILNPPTTAALTRAALSISTAGDNTVVGGTALQTIRVHKLFLVCAASVNVTFKDGASTSLSGAMSFNAGSGLLLPFDTEPWFVTTAGNAFIINLGSAKQVSGVVYYTKS